MRTRKRPPSHPGAILKLHYLEPTGISVTELAKELILSRKTVSKILNEHGAVTTDVALRLSRAFDTTELWLTLQRNYDLWHTAHETTDWQGTKPYNENRPCKRISGGICNFLKSLNLSFSLV